MVKRYFLLALVFALLACSEDPSRNSHSDASTPSDQHISSDLTPLQASCESLGGSSTVETPILKSRFYDRWHEAWLASPSIADLDRDGKNEVIIARSEVLIVFNNDGSIKWKKEVEGRIWSSPLVIDLSPVVGLEVIVASRGKIYGWNAKGESLSGFPIEFRDELRSLAAGDIDGDGNLEIVTLTTNPLSANGKRDIINAYKADGNVCEGFPPNTTNRSGCDDACYITGGYDQNLAVGDVDGDGNDDIFGAQDNAYLSLHHGSGVAFDVASIFEDRIKWPGIRFLLDYAISQQGWSDDEENDNQAHFTNSAPAIADIDGDGNHELVILSSVQNASQSDRKRGVALFVLNKDGTRPNAWIKPYHAESYLAGLEDFSGSNIVGATNQVSIADINSTSTGLEMIFAGFDGYIHCVSAKNESLWRYQYTNDKRVLTGGVLIADLSKDGVPEVIFTSYSPDNDKSHLFILNAQGKEQHKIALPSKGSMAVPAIDDLDGDGELDIIINLVEAVDKEEMVLVYSVPNSANNCLLWSTGRKNLRRNAYLP